MKKNLASALLLFMSASLIVLQSCQKNETFKNLPVDATSTSKGGTGGGGTGGGGKGGGGAIAPPTDPSLAPADTTASQLAVGDIITVGHWKLTSFVQGKDNNTSQFAQYVFTFNADGSMTATDDKGIQTIGYWHYQDAIFYYGLPVYGSSPYGFTMTIGTDLPLTSLNENYFISKKTLTTIYIDSINPNENAHITFSKLLQ